MNPRTNKKMEMINDRLCAYNQIVRVTNLSAISAVLNTGQVLTGADCNRFINRIMNTVVDAWVKNTDDLLSGNVSDKDIKAISFSIGGKAVQKKHGEKIKQQLNTGKPWNKGMKGNYPYNNPCKDSTKTKISEKNLGAKNGMYGKKMPATEKEKRSRLMKDLIISGKFTPNSNNRNTHWESSLDDLKFRSSWEALYQFNHPTAEYESLRIEYDIGNVTKIYIVDFVDHINKVVTEVKPEELCSGLVFAAKLNSLENWAKGNNYSVIIATREFLTSFDEPVEYSRFDNNTQRKIKQLYETSKKN
jgi:hypothetical protein